MAKAASRQFPAFRTPDAARKARGMVVCGFETFCFVHAAWVDRLARGGTGVPPP